MIYSICHIPLFVCHLYIYLSLPLKHIHTLRSLLKPLLITEKGIKRLIAVEWKPTRGFINDIYPEPIDLLDGKNGNDQIISLSLSSHHSDFAVMQAGWRKSDERRASF